MVVKGGYWGSTGSIGGIQRPSWTGSRAGSPRNGLAGAHGCCRSGRVRRLPPAEPRALRAQGAGLLAPCKPRGGAAYLPALRKKLSIFEYIEHVYIQCSAILYLLQYLQHTNHFACQFFCSVLVVGTSQTAL